jgi:hypothetical protein
MAADMSFAEVRRVVIATLERAADTLKRLPMPRNGRPSQEQSSWPSLPNGPADARDQASSHAPKIPPGPRAISELDCVLPWLRLLDGPERRMVWARAAGLSWPRLAREFGGTVGQVRYRWNGAIDRVVAAAVHDMIVTGPGAGPRRGSCQMDRIAR